jgi:ribosomal protein S20
MDTSELKQAMKNRISKVTGQSKEVVEEIYEAMMTKVDPSAKQQSIFHKFIGINTPDGEDVVNPSIE